MDAVLCKELEYPILSAESNTDVSMINKKK